MHQLRTIMVGVLSWGRTRAVYSVGKLTLHSIYAVLILAFAGSVVGCGSNNANKPQAEGLPTMGNASVPSSWEEYHLDEIGFSIRHPETWKVGIEMVEPGFGAMFEIVDSQIDEDIQSSLMFEVFPTNDEMIPGEMDLNSSEGVLSYISQQIEASGEYELGETYTRDVSGYPSALCSFKSVLEDTPAEGFILVFVTSEDVWIITGVASDAEINTANASVYGDMLKSIFIEE